MSNARYPDAVDDARDDEPLQLERVYQQIKSRIVYGHYGPGKVLSESVLARVHGSSRTPVREAIKILAAAGLLTLSSCTIEPTVVAPASTPEVTTQRTTQTVDPYTGTSTTRKETTTTTPGY